MPVSNKEFLDVKATIECGFTLKHVHDMIRTYIQMHHTDKYSHHSSIIWPVWLSGWVFVYELSGCGFESCCCHLKNKCLKSESEKDKLRYIKHKHYYAKLLCLKKEKFQEFVGKMITKLLEDSKPFIFKQKLFDKLRNNSSQKRGQLAWRIKRVADTFNKFSKTSLKNSKLKRMITYFVILQKKPTQY